MQPTLKQDTSVKHTAAAEPLSSLLPHYAFEEVHSILIDAPAEAVMQAVQEQNIAGDPLTRTLLSVRTAVVRWLPRHRHAREFGLHSFTTLYQSQHWYCLGLAGRFWRLDFGLDVITDREAFIRYQRNARLVLAFHAEPCAEGDRTRLTTLTRIQTFDRMAGLMMRLYWLVIRPASGLIRMQMLRRIKSQAEQSDVE
ncbi:DUF2867 domain-containing protein [Pokkaliibacter sp. MBI-7]|uniref:DUF2867 domain-containing protein n=1 Tax=Pokkaliibacter sp. MBI-7 TaxID=3040600 RepID=UPI002448A9DE|nr:DUF2867 domain-containing protein [Pokkaliibacter sp. MBI-7]MDH2435258.1 DUF2867 domain-containing protein [Pokkaliibacter sp. MBI-7]